MKAVLVGFGRWGKNLARVMSRLGVLQAILECDADKSYETGAVYPDIQKFTTQNICNCYEELKALGIDSAVVATPADTHAPLVFSLLAAGFHVYVEKPMALDSTDALQMVLDAKKFDKKLFVGHVFEYHPAINRIAELINTGALGDVQYIASQQLGPGRVRRENVLLSLAPHDVSIILKLMGRMPKYVSAFGVAHEKVAVGTSVISLDFGETKSHVHVSWMSPEKRRALTVIGSKYSVEFNDVAKTLFLYKRTNDINAYGKERIEVFYDSVVEPIALELEAFAKYIDEGVEPPTSGEKAVSVMGVLQAAIMSLANGGEAVKLIEGERRIITDVPWGIRP